MPGENLQKQIADAFLFEPSGVLGVGVSGGGDSIALLHLLHDFCTQRSVNLRAVTMDHGLRPEAAHEANTVKQVCGGLGVAHDTLRWENWDGTGNLQAKARNARYQQMAEWAKQHEIPTIAIGHTADDQAETVLMNLARGSGVNGLAGMPTRVARGGVTWVRPLLKARRTDLRVYLCHEGIDWIDDPSNEDQKFTRIRARKMLNTLSGLGLDVGGLCDVATHMAEARRALDWQTFLTAREIVSFDAGAIVISDRKLRILPDEIQRRMLARAITWVSQESYPPRRAALTNMIQALSKGLASTTDGVHARRVGGDVWIFREYNAVRNAVAPTWGLWDERWTLSPGAPLTDHRKLTVRALGRAGLEQCPDWRDTKRPREVLLSTPAVWQGDQVVAAPLAGMGQKWHAHVNGGEETFFTALLTH